jgi:hypothetical protein
VKNEVLHRVKEERNMLNAIKRRKDNWIDHILRSNYHLKYAIEGNIEREKGQEGEGENVSMYLLGDLKETRSYWKLKEEALDGTPWRTRFGRSYGPVVRQDCVMTCCKTRLRDDLL